MPKAREAAEKALQIDASLAEAHASLGMVRFWYDWDWAAAETEFTRAIELNPGSASAHELYGWYLAAMGRSAQAIAAEKRAPELNPLSAEVNTILGHILYLARSYDQAIEQLRRGLTSNRIIGLDTCCWDWPTSGRANMRKQSQNWSALG